MRLLLLLSLIVIAACTSSSFSYPNDLIPRGDESPENWFFKDLTKTNLGIVYQSNPGYLIEEHYDQVYDGLDVSRVKSVYYAYFTLSNVTNSSNDVGYFAVEYLDKESLELELPKLKDHVYLNDLRNHYIGRIDNVLIKFWSVDGQSPALRDLFFNMQSRVGYEEVQPI